MAEVYNIVKVGDEILRQKAAKVLRFGETLNKMLDCMAATMKEADGVGLAAPQVGISKAVVVIDVGEGLVELINPRIISCSGEELDYEGCLSVPGRRGMVPRAAKVTVKAQNRLAEEIEIEGEGLFARAIQHELDHLDGQLFIDIMTEELFEEDEKA